jgi:hypothetical protein
MKKESVSLPALPSYLPVEFYHSNKDGFRPATPFELKYDKRLKDVGHKQCNVNEKYYGSAQQAAENESRHLQAIKQAKKDIEQFKIQADTGNANVRQKGTVSRIMSLFNRRR